MRLETPGELSPQVRRKDSCYVGHGFCSRVTGFFGSRPDKSVRRICEALHGAHVANSQLTFQMPSSDSPQKYSDKTPTPEQTPRQCSPNSNTLHSKLPLSKYHKLRENTSLRVFDELFLVCRSHTESSWLLDEDSFRGKLKSSRRRHETFKTFQGL